MDKKIKTGSEDEKVKSPNEINDEERQSNSMDCNKGTSSE